MSYLKFLLPILLLFIIFLGFPKYSFAQYTQGDTYFISGRVFIDTNSNGHIDCSGACDGGSGDELGYGSNFRPATITISGPVNQSMTSSSSSDGSEKGRYIFPGLTPGDYTVTITLPNGYHATSATTISVPLDQDRGVVNFGVNNTASPSPTPGCTESAVGANQLVGCLYQNMYLAYPPVKTAFSGAVMTVPVPDVGTALNLDWGTGGPSGMTSDNFSGRWQGNFTFKASRYTFYVGGNDGVRLYVDGTRVIDQFIDRDNYAEFSTSRTFSTQAVHKITVEYYENTGNAKVTLRWTANNVTIQGHNKDQNGNDIVIPGQSISASKFFSTTQTTTLSPAWFFNTLSPGTWTVTATNIAGYVLSYIKCINCSPPTGAYTSGNSLSVALPVAGNYADVYFKYTSLATPTPAPTYSVSGTVFVDSNLNSKQDCSGSCNNGPGDELGYQGAQVTIEPPGGGCVNNIPNHIGQCLPTGSTYQPTDSLGQYQFTNLAVSGTYKVIFEMPAGSTATTATSVSLAVPPTKTGLNFGFVPPTTPTPAPTNAPGTYSVSGTVFADSGSGVTINNGNGSQDSGESGVPGATVKLISPPGSGTVLATTATGVGGSYIFTSVNNNTQYDVQLTLPTGYSSVSNPPNPKTIQISSANLVVNFGMNLSAPSCTPQPFTVIEGQSIQIDPGACTPNIPVATYSWSNPTAGCGSLGGNSGAPVTYNAPSGINDVTVCLVPVQVSNTGGSTNYNVTVNVVPNNILSGHVYEDINNNTCGGSPQAFSGAQVTINNGANPAPFNVTNAAGLYSMSDNVKSSNPRTATISNIAGYHVKAVRFDSVGAFNTSDPNLTGGYNYSFNFTIKTHTLDWCVSNLTSWLQTNGGDVRKSRFSDNLPGVTFNASTGSVPSLFVSSNGPASFGKGTLGGGGWFINSEYSANSDPRTRNGVFSYSFFESRSKTQNTAIKDLGIQTGVACDTAGNCYIASPLATGVYEVHNPSGNLTITNYTYTAGNHVTLLAPGDIHIATDIPILTNAKNLFIVAAQKNVYVDPNVVTLNGIITAEQSIIISSKDAGCTHGIADSKLTFEGNFIANALKPFATDGSGKLQIDRSLCSGADSTQPALTVAYRPDFIPQLTDFYKIPITRWRELNP